MEASPKGYSEKSRFTLTEHPADYAVPESTLVQLTPPKDDGREPRPPQERVADAIFVPTPQDVVEKMLEAANVGKDDLLYDLGSGDGRILIEAAKKHGCRAVGLEIDRDLVNLSQGRTTEAKVEKMVSIKEADIFSADFSDPTVVTVYHYPPILKQLLPKLEQLKPGARIVSHQFEMPDLPAERRITVESNETGTKHTIYPAPTATGTPRQPASRPPRALPLGFGPTSLKLIEVQPNPSPWDPPLRSKVNGQKSLRILT